LEVDKTVAVSVKAWPKVAWLTGDTVRLVLVGKLWPKARLKKNRINRWIRTIVLIEKYPGNSSMYRTLRWRRK